MRNFSFESILLLMDLSMAWYAPRVGEFLRIGLIILVCCYCFSVLFLIFIPCLCYLCQIRCLDIFLGHLSYVIPELQLVSQQAFCSILGEILGRYFLIMGKEDITEKLFELGEFILLFERSIEVEDELFMTGGVLDLSVLFSGQ
ncbi:unnamed protein product [Vicia faba]|uniref:Uncharacterized protein n=1 Tax=Vicia faba TaxID=3906 RepID=A0AAV0Z894_VICFA|nr:unnamed protein product [Vicia faba]